MSLLQWLPAVSREEDAWGESRPIRPNLPFFRWFSYTKWHALQLGALLGLFVYITYRLGEIGVGLGVLVMVLKYVLGYRRVQSEDHRCDHKVGFHDVVKKPHYFGSSLVSTVAVAWYVFEILAFL